jgi:hypothetical protein
MSLSEEQQARIHDRMRRFPWHTWGDWIQEEFKIAPPSRAALYRFREWFSDHEAEYLLTQRIRDRDALERELQAAGATDPATLANVLGNDVVAARARGDDQAVERAIRLYTAVAKVSGDTGRLKLDFDKFRSDMQTDIERGLDALQEEIKGNTEALQLFGKLKSVVTKAVQGAAA